MTREQPPHVLPDWKRMFPKEFGSFENRSRDKAQRAKNRICSIENDGEIGPVEDD